VNYGVVETVVFSLDKAIKDMCRSNITNILSLKQESSKESELAMIPICSHEEEKTFIKK
jgi:hypothetical protein